MKHKVHHSIYVILATVLLWLALLSVTGCKTCPPASVVIHDSIHESIVYIPHDTTIYKTLPPITVTQTLECDSMGIIRSFRRTFKQGGTTITEQVSKGVLTVTCSEDSLKFVITTMNKEKNEFIEHSKSEVKINTVIEQHWYLKYLWIYFIVTMLGFILWIYFKFKPI